VSAFADRRIIALATNDFIPCTADDWYQRRRQDDEGTFFRKVAEQGPRKGAGGSTRQGIYCLTADGELLAFKNAGQDAEITYEQLRGALAKFKQLPAGRRDPGAVAVPEHGKLDPNYSRKVPEGGLVLRVNARILDRTDAGFCKAGCNFPGGDMAARDFLWINAQELAQLAPARPEVNATYPLPAAIAARLCRFHLIDNTRGEPEFWTRAEIVRSEFTLTVTAATDDAVELRIDGTAELRTDRDADKAARGYEPKLSGTLRYRPAQRTFDRAEFAAVGLHWGDSVHTRKGTRPGKGLLGVAFTLADPTVPANRVSPQGIRERGAYERND
jgi:hypothetical protein